MVSDAGAEASGDDLSGWTVLGWMLLAAGAAAAAWGVYTDTSVMIDLPSAFDPVKGFTPAPTQTEVVNLDLVAKALMRFIAGAGMIICGFVAHGIAALQSARGISAIS